MKFRSKIDKQAFALEVGRPDLVNDQDFLDEPELPDGLEKLFLQKRHQIIGKSVNFKKSQMMIS